jgi:hypothetical protein
MEEVLKLLKSMQDEMTKKMDASQEKSHAKLEKADADRKAYREDLKEMRAIIKGWSSDLKTNQEESMACQGNMEAHLETEEPASVDRTPEVAQEQEVPRDDAEVMPVREPRKRRQDRQLLAVGRRKKEEQNLDAGRRGKRRNLVAAHRGTTSREQIARCNVLSTKETRGYCGSQ